MDCGYNRITISWRAFVDRKPVQFILLALLLGVGAGMAPAADDDPETVDIFELTSIEYEEGQPLPEKIQALDGKRVSITGYMGPYTQEDTSEFRLISEECSCDGPPSVQHFVQIELENRKVGYSPESLTVVGVLTVGEKWVDGYVVSIYRIVAETLE